MRKKLLPQKKKTLHVDVTTYVLCSGKMNKPRKKIKAGINTYRIIPIMMREKDAGAFIKVLKEKIQRGEAVTRSDLAWLTLTPLMRGKISQKERILDAYELLRDSTAFSQEEKEKLDSVLYVMANKFLNGKELKKVKEEMQMMPLGRMWREDGIAEGRREGLTEGLAAIIKIIRGKMQKGLSCETVAEFLEMDVSYIKKIYNLIQEQPDQTDLQIAQILLMPK